jgi:hypothetical protein
VARLLCLRGELVVVGKSPDGDSIRFRTLISQAGDRISLEADPLDLVFSEK